MGRGNRIRRALGMIPDKPMAECSECGHMSYLAAIEGICLNCSMNRGLIVEDGPPEDSHG